MIVPLKIVVCSLKSVKRLPGVQKDSLVLNKLGSLDFVVLNTLESLDSPMMNTPGSQFLVYLEQASEQVYKRTLW
jgi:hypothetical protein